MARIVMVGGGVVGLCGALLLGRDGHDVVVLERDAAPPPDPDKAWADWERRGVNQFRMLHYLLPGFRELMEEHAPDVITRLRELGAASLNPMRDAPELFTGGYRDADAKYESVTARRPVAEAAIASLVQGCPNVSVRRGVAVTGLLTDGAPHGISNIIGVRTDSGEEVHADLVVDAGGRRSTLPTLLTDIGASAPLEEKADCGFVYYGRHFSSGDGSVPAALGGLLAPLGTLSVLTLPADNGTWGIGVIASAKDTAMRALSDVETWTRVVKSLPLHAHWLEGTPLDDGVAIMAKIEDRHRSFVIDGTPVATGVVALADSWACTNPSVGRGITIGTIHAVALRDVVRAGLSDPVEFQRAWQGATLAEAEGWYRSTLAFDSARLDEIHAELEGREFHPTPEYEITKSMEAAAFKDPEMLRSLLDIAGMLNTADDVLSRPGVLERAAELGHDWRDQPPLGPSRQELLAIVGGNG